eukprot:TRINITY_DN5522_c0_g2_i1.p1 TRINITY_DN5522_c0_g2~~TRINITY_DN5522_c0_g2_i1.p1  ORF type:complete len:198 (-),score=63.83 TRINITY_DN5522_c0_g2_i1:223-816(-)
MSAKEIVGEEEEEEEEPVAPVPAAASVAATEVQGEEEEEEDGSASDPSLRMQPVPEVGSQADDQAPGASDDGPSKESFFQRYMRPLFPPAAADSQPDKPEPAAITVTFNNATERKIAARNEALRKHLGARLLHFYQQTNQEVVQTSLDLNGTLNLTQDVSHHLSQVNEQTALLAAKLQQQQSWLDSFRSTPEVRSTV